MSTESMHTILVVDDEDAILEMLQTFLKRFDYKVLTASNGREAIRIVAEYREDIHLLITDVAMSGMDGSQLAKHLVALRPIMKVIFISAYPQQEFIQQGLLSSDRIFIQKPFDLGDILDKIRAMLN